jgi:PKD repeat protein
MRYIYTLLILLCLFCTAVHAQKEATIWYFGEEAGLDFNSGAPVPLLDGVMKAFEGCASIADKNGRLLFYSNGTNVWNRNHQLMPNGTGLQSNYSATQAAVIVPQPGSTNRYYIFTVDRAEEAPGAGLSYSVVDMSAVSGGGLGDVVTKNILLLPTSTEKITAVKHRNGIDVWLVAHELSSNVFHSYLITPTGITTTSVRSAAGTVYRQGVGYLKASQDGSRLAAAVDFNLFEVYSFNTATGTVSAPIPLPFSPLHWCYGVEFSPNGKLLYGSKAATSRPYPTEVHQFDLEAGSPAQITASAILVAVVPVTDATTELGTSAGALQIGPDNRIYLARLYSEYLGVITRPDVRGAGCRYVPDEVHLSTRLSMYGLPTINNSYYRVPEFLFTGLCFGDSTHFRLSPDAFPVDSVLWNFGDETTGEQNTSGIFTPSHLFSTPGDYMVTLVMFREDRADTVSRTITIFPTPEIGLGRDTTVCAGTRLVLSAKKPSFVSYLWSTGETTDTIVVTTPGIYRVVVSDGMCTAEDSIAVTFLSPRLRAEGTTSICRGQSAQLAAISENNLSYHWEPEDGLNNPFIAMPVARPTTTTTYTVIGTGAAGCTTSASVTITVDEAPQLDLGNDIVTCEGSTVHLDAFVPHGVYLWSTGETTPTITVGQTGVYSVVVTAGSCTVMDAIRVDFSGFELTVSPGRNICQGSSIHLSASGAQFYEWSPVEGLDDPTKPDPIATPGQTTTYRVIGRNAQGCRDTADVTIFVDQPFTVSLPGDTVLCRADSYILRTDEIPGVLYLWSTGETTASITVRTTGTYSVTATRGSCTATSSATVIFAPVALGVGTPPELCEGDTTRLTATGAQLYRWEPADGLSDPTSASPLAFPTKTTTYTVTGSNTSGCSDVQEVTVHVRPKNHLHLSMTGLAAPSSSQNMSIPVLAEVPASELPLTISNLTVELRWNAFLFLPLSASHGVMSERISNNDRIVTLDFGTITLTEPRQMLTEISGTVLLGESITTDLSFPDVRHESCLAVTTQKGQLSTEACFIRGRAVKLFAPTSLAVTPNPSGGETTIHIHSSENNVLHTISVYDLHGKRLWESDFTGTSSADNYVITIPEGAVPAGVYEVVLTTPSGAWTAMLHIVR